LTKHFPEGGHDVISHRKCCYLVSADAASARCINCSVRQFLICIVHVLFLPVALSTIVIKKLCRSVSLKLDNIDTDVTTYSSFFVVFYSEIFGKCMTNVGLTV